MAIKKPDGKKPRSYGANPTPDVNEAGSIGGTFRQDSPAGEKERKRPTTKTTLEIDTELFKALKLHAVTEDVFMRDLVDRYVRAGLESDGVALRP